MTERGKYYAVLLNGKGGELDRFYAHSMVELESELAALITSLGWSLKDGDTITVHGPEGGV